ncbi:hypothetical protein PPERSA_11275 [Pseudocohnilembus persalinus]|uniref:NAD(P)(+)--arginine ADP-ribosyltransferase n=1 Tax=Pseudocohnilembus persalinus TaxID=266149 RepID=A0A0V0QPZ2_PSEPJ|nr:hypothetical protein PPERSA_11275 [Pseudocohnilembus persalinus]|eukprot:KRX04151.1 hypothetical protein PPERSA_11275 [Pseudocohnilembus persalinus]
MIYNQYRFKGIVVLTDDYGMQLNKKWVKKYSRITLLTQSFEQSSKELTKLVNNTLFRGACKFKDLDHFLGKQKKIQSYFLKTQDQMKQYANINEYRKNRKNFKQGSQLNVIYEEIQQINDMKEMDEDQILNDEINEDIKHEMKFQNIISFYNRQKLKEKPSYKELQKRKKDQIKNSQKGIIQDNSILILNSFDEASKDYDFYLNKLHNARDIIKNKNILIRNDMLQEKCLQNIAKLYVECFNSGSQEQIVKNILNLYTKKETELYAIVNCALNTLNESLIMELQDIIKCLRYCLQEYDDQDDYFQLGQVINLWRGCTYDREYFQKFFKVGEYIVFPGYASTSTDLQESLKFSKLGNEKRIIFQLEFVCDEKMMKYRPKNLKNISAYPQENEFLLNCFSIFYIEEINPDFQDGYLLYKLKMIQ